MPSLGVAVASFRSVSTLVDSLCGMGVSVLCPGELILRTCSVKASCDRVVVNKRPCVSISPRRSSKMPLYIHKKQRRRHLLVEEYACLCKVDRHKVSPCGISRLKRLRGSAPRVLYRAEGTYRVLPLSDRVEIEPCIHQRRDVK